MIVLSYQLSPFNDDDCKKISWFSTFVCDNALHVFEKSTGIVFKQSNFESSTKTKRSGNNHNQNSSTVMRKNIFNNTNTNTKRKILNKNQQRQVELQLEMAKQKLIMNLTHNKKLQAPERQSSQSKISIRRDSSLVLDSESNSKQHGYSLAQQLEHELPLPALYREKLNGNLEERKENVTTSSGLSGMEKKRRKENSSELAVQTLSFENDPQIQWLLYESSNWPENRNLSLVKRFGHMDSFLSLVTVIEPGYGCTCGIDRNNINAEFYVCYKKNGIHSKFNHGYCLKIRVNDDSSMAHNIINMNINNPIECQVETSAASRPFIHPDLCNHSPCNDFWFIGNGIDSDKFISISKKEGYNVYDTKKHKWLLNKNFIKKSKQEFEDINASSKIHALLFLDCNILIVSKRKKLYFYDLSDILNPQLITTVEIEDEYVSHGLTLIDYNYNTETNAGSFIFILFGGKAKNPFYTHMTEIKCSIDDNGSNYNNNKHRKCKLRIKVCNENVLRPSIFLNEIDIYGNTEAEISNMQSKKKKIAKTTRLNNRKKVSLLRDSKQYFYTKHYVRNEYNERIIVIFQLEFVYLYNYDLDVFVIARLVKWCICCF